MERAGTPVTQVAGRPTLARRPASGPSFQPPDTAADLRVAGAAPLPPGNVPDPTGTVRLSPWRSTVHRRQGAPRPAAAPPRQRWEAAVAARPLEAPRPLPAAFHGMAAAITGTAHPPRYTAGPATRHALAAAGALGATTGSVVHLPAPPTPATAPVLAHELAHARQPVRRPRFLLAGLSGALDDDERGALAAGRNAPRPPSLGGLARAGADRVADMSAGIVDRLPVGSGGMGAVTDVATRAARATIIEAGASVPNLPNLAAGNGGPAPAPPAAPTGGAAAPPAGGTVTGTAAPAPAEAAPAAAAPPPLDVERVVEAVEERLLREIERRGGRWAGVF